MMKNRHIPYVFSMVWAIIGPLMSYAETVELGSPLPGRILVKIHSDVISKRIQISGSLNPLRIFINGQERTSELVNGQCPVEGTVNLNGKPIETKGAPGIFFWEGTQDQEKLSLAVRAKEKCLTMESKVPLAFFEKPYREEVYLDEKDYPLTWEIKLEGDKVSDVNVVMDQGNLKVNEKWVFSHSLKPGTNIVTGILKDQTGKVTPLLLKFYFTVETPKENGPGLVFNFSSEESLEKLKVSGKVNKGNRLFINGEEAEISEDQEFKIKRDVEFGENVFIFESMNALGLKTTFTKTITRVQEPEKRWPILPSSSYLGIGLLHLHALKSIEADLRVTETPLSYLVYGMRLGKNNDPWEFHLRYVDKTEVYQDRNEPPIILKRHIGIGAIRLFPWKKAIHFGLGLSFEHLTREETNNGNTDQAEGLDAFHVIGKIGWMKTFGEHWAWMPSFAPFIAVPIGKGWETFGFDLSPFTVVYSF